MHFSAPYHFLPARFHRATGPSVFRSFLLLAGLLLLGGAAAAQTPLRITLVSDAAPTAGVGLDSLIGEELQSLLGTRFKLQLDRRALGQAGDSVIDRAYAEADLVIGTGIASSQALLDRSSYPKPTIAAIVVDPTAPADSVGTGVPNLTYVRSPFDIRRDLDTLATLHEYDRLTVVTTENFREPLALQLADYPGAEVTVIAAQPTAAATWSHIPTGTDAVYFTPVTEVLPAAEARELLGLLNDGGIATMSLLDYPLLELGVLAAYSSEDNISRLPRRVALDALRITDGLDPATFSTRIEGNNQSLIINMAAARASGIYPAFDVMRRSVLLNPVAVESGPVLTLEGAIVEGLARNLGYRIDEYEVALARTDVEVAEANLLPQLGVGTSLTLLDPQTTASSFGLQGRYNWTGSATLSQVILSEPAFANVAIQRLLAEGQEEALRSSQLDVVLDVSTAYLNVLQSKEFLRLQNENLNVTRANYDLAVNQRELGAAAATDVYRWESELALGSINVNDAEARLAQARYQLNQLLDHDIDAEFRLPTFTGQDSLLGIIGETLLPLLKTPRDIDRLADFLADEARRNLPTLRQLDLAIAAQERQAKARERAFYLPEIGVEGQLGYRIGNYATTPLPEEFNFDFAAADRPWGTYTIAVGASIPIFQGGLRRAQLEQAKLSALQTATQRENTENQLVQRLYSSVETLVASYRNLRLAREAAATSERNFAIIEDLYRSGAANVTSLVDAQNVVLQSRVNATNLGYQFVADFLTVQRSTGSYQFLAEPAEQTAFLQRFLSYRNDQ
ncbi:outer membrane protein TolC [Neolewinella xylanilytica]|uniref:Outer membrane protein TolC n=1 Tax=Neolewinella xylanilytica TaxID=1514080 RepID=A0A2S6I215_9BACT|nr:TolC family protein [Neolewinella xylanilytica]PPK85218.1 outer membrane protein TolC [Neolewinella xylanilytica]